MICSRSRTGKQQGLLRTDDNITEDRPTDTNDPLTRAAFPLVVVLSGMIFVPGIAGWFFPNPVHEPDPIALDQTLRIDLNAADDRLLRLLPGVGPKTASRLIATRKRIGGFETWGDVETTPGVGPKTIEAMQPWAYVGQFDEMLVDQEQ